MHNTITKYLDNWQVITDIQCELGEGPLWDYFQRLLYWIDITQQYIHWYDAYTGQRDCIRVPQRIGTIALTNQPFVLLAALKHGFYEIDLKKQAFKPIHDPESDLVANRFNDGKIDPFGNFVAGTMDEVKNTKEAGGLYRLKPNFQVEKLLDNVSCANGLCWSHDHTKFFFIDTGIRSLFSFDYDIEGLKNQSLIYKFSDNEGIPDGMTIDTEGKLWIALWNGAKVIRLDPEVRKILLEIKLPVTRVTSCTFGGPNLNNLYITTAKIGLSEDELKAQPLAGSTFVINNMPYSGHLSTVFQLQ